jgi:hypothetical protein
MRKNWRFFKNQRYDPLFAEFSGILLQKTPTL